MGKDNQPNNEMDNQFNIDEQLDIENYENKLDTLKETIKQLKKVRKKKEKIDKLEKEREHILKKMGSEHRDKKKKHR